jgi:putative nucleotidyltransferase with HDIG domain
MKATRKKERLKTYVDADTRIRWAILGAVSVLFAIILFPNLVITRHQYAVGDVAERDIKAPRDFFIEDKTATEAKRQLVEQDVLTVYDYDSELAERLSRNVEQAFAEMRVVLEAAKPGNSVASPAPAADIVEDQTAARQAVWDKHTQFEEKLGIRVSQGALDALVQEGFSKELVTLMNTILAKIMENGVVINKEILLKESDRGIVLREVSTKKERVVQNLKQFYSLDQAKTMVRVVGQPLLKDLDYTQLNLVVDCAQRLIQPNITLNRSETEERRKAASADIRPVLLRIKAGEMLLREGERVTDLQLLKLKTLQSETKKEQILVSSLGAVLLLLCLLATTHILHLNPQDPKSGSSNKNLLLMAAVWVTFFFVASVSASLFASVAENSIIPIPASSISFGLPLAAGAMIICIFLGLSVAVPFALVLAVCAAAIYQNSFELFIYFLVNGTMAAYWIRNCRERKIFIIAGAKLGVLNMVLATAVNLYLNDVSGSKMLWDWAFGFAGGIGAAIVTAGIAPLVEIAFDYTTDITLLELANLDRPLLRQLMIEAPGTYHHSVIVGSLVEAAAAEIGANPLLAKVCGYYHDIGKVRKPLYFIENQTDGKNKHDKLAPSMSSLILIAHVKDGVETAKAHKLGQVIIDTIRQHHGTSLIKYFYEKAKVIKGEDAVNIDHYRYPGPKPQTREAGLVMLADVVEAASRTLDNPTPARIQGLVANLINKIFSDGQLDECELTLKDLHSIARIFNKILTGIHHHRVEYFEKPDRVKARNGSSDKQHAKQAQDAPEEDSTNGSGRLRRLGLS